MDWKQNEARGIDALKRKTSAAADIIRCAVRLVDASQGSERLERWPAFEQSVLQYVQASKEFKAAQDAVGKLAATGTAG